MTTLSKEDVVRWAREAGCNIITTPDDVIARYNDVRVTNMLGRFAEAARADLVAENERLKSIPMKYRRMAFNAELQDENKKLRTALAAAEARESATRAILDQVMDDIRSEAFLFDGGNGISADTEDAADNLLDQPRDDSALREMIAGVYEECAKVCDGKDGDGNIFADDAAKSIRALAEKKLASLTS